ncbi:hypothetical protein C808_00576 [Lachnospiraceae bacterium M18-1]|nr:hypothetical protein C808_00576 [Lachnospiraceae bacterium M18-1]
MDAEYITRQEHTEFAARQDAENTRQNRRIELLEENVREIRDLASSVEKLAVNMENMLKSQEQQADRLEVLEGRDGEMWRKVSGYIVTVIIGIVVGFIFTQIGF